MDFWPLVLSIITICLGEIAGWVDIHAEFPDANLLFVNELQLSESVTCRNRLSWNTIPAGLSITTSELHLLSFLHARVCEVCLAK